MLGLRSLLTWRRPLIVGFLLMFTSSYIDNLRGPILPVIKETLGLSQQYLSLFLVLGHLAAIVGVFTLLHSFNRFREATLLSISLGIASLLAAIVYLPSSIYWFFLLGGWFGLSNTSVATFSNIWVLRGAKKDSEAEIMSALHMLYGLGSLVATSVVGYLFYAGWDWRLGVFLSLIPLGILAVLVSGEKRVNKHVPIEQENTKLNSTQCLLLLLFAVYVTSEVTTSMWLSNYLHQVEHVSLSTASFAATAFFAMMTVTRGLCFFIAKPKWQIKLLWAGVLLPIFFHSIGHLGYWPAFCAAGFYGPFFPILMARIKKTFPAQWRSVTTWVVFSMQVVLGMIHFGMGFLADTFGIAMAYKVPLISCLLLVPLLAVYLRLEARAKVG